MRRRRSLATLCGIALLSVAVGVHGLLLGYRYSPANYPAMAEWAGCHAQVVTRDMSPSRSYYSVEDHILLIGVGDDPGIPYWAGLLILFHETGHCLQAESGALEVLYATGGFKAIELDADRQAADLACGLGLDGKRLLRDLFVWAHETYGYDGDDYHGTLDERIAQGDNAARCHVVEPQS